MNVSADRLKAQFRCQKASFGIATLEWNGLNLASLSSLSFPGRSSHSTCAPANGKLAAKAPLPMFRLPPKGIGLCKSTHGLFCSPRSSTCLFELWAFIESFNLRKLARAQAAWKARNTRPPRDDSDYTERPYVWVYLFIVVLKWNACNTNLNCVCVRVSTSRLVISFLFMVVSYAFLLYVISGWKEIEVRHVRAFRFHFLGMTRTLISWAFGTCAIG